MDMNRFELTPALARFNFLCLAFSIFLPSIASGQVLLEPQMTTASRTRAVLSARPLPPNTVGPGFLLSSGDLRVIPRAAPAGIDRWVLAEFSPSVSRCVAAELGSLQPTPGLDASALDREGLAVLKAENTSCNAPVVGVYKIAVSRLGAAKVRLINSSSVTGTTTSEVTLMTTAALPQAKSKFDVNGMWIDDRTIGSGVSIYHNRQGTDAAFATWFVFGGEGATRGRWFSVQGAYWSDTGNVLNGVAFSTPRAEDFASCQHGFREFLCPVTASAIPEATVKISFSSATSATAEVRDPEDNLLFTSQLRKLDF